MSDSIYSRILVAAIASALGVGLIRAGLFNVRSETAEETGGRRVVNSMLGITNSYTGRKAVVTGYVRIALGVTFIIFGVVYLIFGPILAR